MTKILLYPFYIMAVIILSAFSIWALWLIFLYILPYLIAIAYMTLCFFGLIIYLVFALLSGSIHFHW